MDSDIVGLLPSEIIKIGEIRDIETYPLCAITQAEDIKLNQLLTSLSDVGQIEAAFLLDVTLF